MTLALPADNREVELRVRIRSMIKSLVAAVALTIGLAGYAVMKRCIITTTSSPRLPEPFRILHLSLTKI
jgi:hypothetical protein